MLLNELAPSINPDGILVENVSDLCRYIRSIYDVAQDDSPTDESYKAAQYLAFLMAYRDLDYATKDTGNNPLPIEHFLQPGIESAMKALQFFSKKCGDHSNIMKKVDGYTERFMKPEIGRKKFDYQLNKIDLYFKRRQAETVK